MGNGFPSMPALEIANLRLLTLLNQEERDNLSRFRTQVGFLPFKKPFLYFQTINYICKMEWPFRPEK